MKCCSTTNDPSHPTTAKALVHMQRLGKMFWGAASEAPPSPGEGHRVWMTVDTNRFCDCLELIIKANPSPRLVAAWPSSVNQVLEQEGVGFRMTDAKLERKPNNVHDVEVAVYPIVIRSPSAELHAAVIEPALRVLAKPIFHHADKELRDAFAAHRAGKFGQANTSVGAAFESVLKAICDAKNWPYDPQKDTLSKLIGICRDRALFPGFYAPVFEGVGTIRNKLGAHGSPVETPTSENVDHLIQLTCSHVLLVVAMARV
ncbi:MAG: hypothetical protein QM770_01105 [Tepidisphaeraceae bacterium]